jgi:BirA family biotin operon repressor/biotin-[acetyl-CoA-carboxylase] ligase
VNNLMTPTILRFDSLPSTNTEAANQAIRGAAEGLCIIAREQTKGRGREGRTWISPKDSGLYFSIVLRPRLSVSDLPLITLMAAVAVHRALETAFGLITDIKWPNDIYAEEKKLCGILAETVETDSGRAVILGIGINLSDEALPVELKETATSLQSLLGAKPDIEKLLEALTQSISFDYLILHSENGIESTLQNWKARSSYTEGKSVRVILANESFEGITRGLNTDGSLRIETANGNTKTVRAGDVIGVRKKGEGEKG